MPSDRPPSPGQRGEAPSQPRRDFKGYGRERPNADWPGGARVAVMFVLNYEEGGERCILNGDATSEAFLSDIVNAEAWPGQRHMNMESLYEYGARAGFWRLWHLFTKRNVAVTVQAVTKALAAGPEQTAAMVESGWEMASHSLRWIDYRNVPIEVERDHIKEAVAQHEALTGSRPPGWYTGRTSENTIDLLAEDGSFLYLADSYADDLPYWITPAARDPQLIVPYAMDTNDMRFLQTAGFRTADEFFCYLRDAFDALYDEGAERPAMMSVGLHCRIIGRPGRVASLVKFLDYIETKADVWVTRRVDLARHWRARHPLRQGG